MPEFHETRFDPPTSFEGQENLLKNQRNLWMKIKSSKLFNWLRHSPLNPYHFGVKKIKAETPEEEQKIAREKSLSQYINKKGVRCAVTFDGSVNEEYEKTGKVLRGRGDVSHLIPRNKDGKLDLMAEEPILFAVVPLEGISITGHVGIQYKDRVINRVLEDINMEPIYPRYQFFSDYYFVYPSQVGINPDKLIKEMDKHNIKYGQKKYDIVKNNCAKNVAILLKKLGIKDINFFGPDKIGLTFASPGNNPFHFGIEDWCMRHGIPVRLDEVALLYNHHEIPKLEERKEEFKAKRERYERRMEYVSDSLNKSKLGKLRKKIANFGDKVLKTKRVNKKLPIKIKRIEKNFSDKFFGNVKE